MVVEKSFEEVESDFGFGLQLDAREREEEAARKDQLGASKTREPKERKKQTHRIQVEVNQ